MEKVIEMSSQTDMEPEKCKVCTKDLKPDDSVMVEACMSWCVDGNGNETYDVMSEPETMSHYNCWFSVYRDVQPDEDEMKTCYKCENPFDVGDQFVAVVRGIVSESAIGYDGKIGHGWLQTYHVDCLNPKLK